MFISKPRTKGRVNSDIKAKDIYNYYLDNIKPVESLAGGKTIGSFKITQKEHNSILKDLNKAIIDIIILENFEFKMPCQLGLLSMQQKPINYRLDEEGELITKRLAVDYKALRELWSTDKEAKSNKTLVFHVNDNTNGNRMSYYWDKFYSKCFAIRVYYFVASRYMKRLPAQYLKDTELKLGFYARVTRGDRYHKIQRNKDIIK